MQMKSKAASFLLLIGLATFLPHAKAQENDWNALYGQSLGRLVEPQNPAFATRPYWQTPSFKVPPAWKPQKVAGKEFRFMAYDEEGDKSFWDVYPGLMQRPLFTQSARWLGEGGGVYRQSKERLEKELASSTPNFQTFERFDAPFTFYAHTNFRTDAAPYNPQTYQQFLQKYDERFLGHIISEWGHAMLNSPDWLKAAPTDRKEAHDLLKAMWLRSCQQRMMQDADGKMRILSWVGYENFDHYGAEWGAHTLATELGENVPHANRSLAFIRGAARQYQLPWMADYSSWFYSRMGKPNGDIPRGHSDSLCRRIAYVSYMAGANFFNQENIHFGYKSNDNYVANLAGNLTPMGKMLDEWYNTVSGIDRGIPYTPVAVLQDYYHGMGRSPVKRWGKFELNDSDHMQEQTLYQFFPNPAGFTPGIGDQFAEQQFLTNTPMGDVADVLLPNAPSKEIEQELIDRYSVVLLSGEMQLSPQLTQRLEQFVRQGGSLVVNAVHFNAPWSKEFTPQTLNSPQRTASTALCRLSQKTFDSKPFSYVLLDAKNQQVVASTNEPRQAQTPLVLMKRIGQGRLFTVAVPYTLDSEKKLLPFYTHFLAGIVKSTLPVQVEGNIQYLFNKNQSGWVVTLVNNRGFYKLARGSERIDPQFTQTVKLRFPTTQRQATAHELIGKTALTIEHGRETNSLNVEVAPGEVKIIQLQF